jgi:hypothetical protein
MNQPTLNWKPAQCAALQAKQACSYQAGGLERFCPVAFVAKIMLRANLLIERGFVNCLVGIAHNNFLSCRASSFTICCCVHFPFMHWPFLSSWCTALFFDHTQQASMRTWSLVSNVFSRTGLPLSLAWSLTIHKSQGLTIPKPVVDITPPAEMSAGLSFVALFRVRRLQDVILVPFEQPCLMDLSLNNSCCAEIKKKKERLHQL